MFISLLAFAKDRKAQKNLVRIRYDTRKPRQLPSWSWVGWQGSVSIRMFDAVGTCVVEDSANIICNNTPTSWGVQPKLRNPTHPLRISLHLWAQTIRCYVVPQLRQHHSHQSRVFIESPENQQRWAPFESLLPKWHVIVHCALPKISTHQIIVLHGVWAGARWLPVFLILTEGGPLDAERIGYIEIIANWRYFDYRVGATKEDQASAMETLESVSVNSYTRLT